MDKPTQAVRPPEYSPSFKELGIIAQPGCLIEVRAPDPDSKVPGWPRIWLTRKAAETLLEWLPQAMEKQEQAFVVPSSRTQNTMED